MTDKNKQYTTRSGLPVRIYATDAGGEYPVHGAILINGVWTSRSWTREGRYYINLNHDSCYDLIEAKPRIKATVWLNINSSGIGKLISGGWYSSRIDADKYATSDRIACIQIEIDCEQGEGL